MQIIDIYTHIFPDEFFAEMTKASQKLGSIANGCDPSCRCSTSMCASGKWTSWGTATSRSSRCPNPPIEDIVSGPIATHLARVANDSMAQLCAKHPDRFPGFAAALNMLDMDGAVAEGQRAIKQLGARGLQIYTNVAGRPLDDPAYLPIFALAAEHDLPIWLHPARTASDMPDYTSEKVSRYEMWWCFGWPYETSVAMARLVFCGMFDRFPKLKIITHHCGGMIPYYDGARRNRARRAGRPHRGRGLHEGVVFAEATASRVFP